MRNTSSTALLHEMFWVEPKLQEVGSKVGRPRVERNPVKTVVQLILPWTSRNDAKPPAEITTQGSTQQITSIARGQGDSC